MTSGAYDRAAEALRAPTGAPLDETTRRDLLRHWERQLGAGGSIHITGVEYTGNRPLSDGVLRALRAEAGFQLVFTTLGSSETPCFRVPVEHATARVAKIEGRWFVVQEAPGAYFFPCIGG